MKTWQVKRGSEVTTNELMRSMLAVCWSSQLQVRFGLLDNWYASQENFAFIDKKAKHVIADLKDNRLVVLNEDDKTQGRLLRIDALSLGDTQAVRGWLNNDGKKVLLVWRIFTNQDGSTGVLNLVSIDVTLDGESAAAIYPKRWKVEAFHKALTSNAVMGKSPTQTVTTQNNHVLMAIFAVFKLKCLTMRYQGYVSSPGWL